jgi:hypothetical protein
VSRTSQASVPLLAARHRTATSTEMPRSASMRARVAFLPPDNRFVLVCEVGEFSPALGHCYENRGALKRHVSSLCACRAI